MANLNTIKDVVMENKEIEELRWQLEKQRIAKQYWFSKYKELKKEIKELKENNETLSRCGIQQSAYLKEIKENETSRD